MDIDLFKGINDNYGHDVGDKVLVRVAHVLQESFRGADRVCRIGGDEFAVIMTGMTSDKKDLIRSRVAHAAAILGHSENDIPAVTISAGCAFSDQLSGPDEDLFKNADRALYAVKDGGRGDCSFYSKAAPAS